MAASPLRKLLVQFSHYSLAGFLTTLASVISFPFLTRIFPTSDYGLMSLISTTLGLLVAVGKLGLQHAIIRVHGEVRSGKHAANLRTFYSTALLSMMAAGVVAAALWAVVSQALPLGWLGESRLRYLFLLTAVIVMSQIVESALVNFARADQLTSALARYQVAKKYAGLALIIVFLLFVARGLEAFYSAMILTEVGFTLALGLYFFRAASGRPRPSPQAFSPPLMKELLTYGIPMMLGYEVAGVILTFGDRYVIQGMIGGASLGVYSAAYNLCMYVDSFFISAVGQALIPIYMRIWSESGEAETRKFLGDALRYYVLLAVPVGAGLSAVGPQLLPLVASEKYEAGAIVIPFVIGGLVLAGSTAFLGAGLFLSRRTFTIGSLILSSAVLNIGLNFYLVPRQGIEGAALATLLSYAYMAAAMAFFGLRRLRFPIPWGAIGKALFAASLMYFSVRRLHVGGRLADSVLRVSIGVLIYAPLIAALDEKARDAMLSGARRAREALRSA